MNAPAPTFVCVGHCGPDVAALRAAVGRAVPGARTVAVNSETALGPYLGPDSVLLVNRVLDGEFSDDGGVELIRRALSRERPPRALLVSNIPDAQREAAAAGALPGLGKKQLYDATTAEKLRHAAGNPGFAQHQREGTP